MPKKHNDVDDDIEKCLVHITDVDRKSAQPAYEVSWSGVLRKGHASREK